MENENPQLPPAKSVTENVEPPAQAEIPDAALEEVTGGLLSQRFPSLPPVKKWQPGILTPLSDD